MNTVVDGGVRMEAGPSTPPPTPRGRGGRVLAAAGLAVVLFAVGGVGLFRAVHPQPDGSSADAGSADAGSALGERLPGNPIPTRFSDSRAPTGSTSPTCTVATCASAG